MMAGRVPVLRQDDMAELFGNAIDERDDLVGSGNGKRASLAEIVLDVDDQQNVGAADFHIADHETLAPSWARRRSVSSVSRRKGSDIVTRVGCLWIEMAQRFGQPFQVAGGARSNLCQSGRGANAAARFHHRLKERLPGCVIAFKLITSPAIRPSGP